MKIGILTFHVAHNYGAVLQSYALQAYLRSRGHEAYLIDYRPKYLTRVYRRFGLRRWVSVHPLRCYRKFRRQLSVFRSSCERYAKFTRFIQSCLPLWAYRSPADLSGLDLVLLGSDQIWNKGITGGRPDDLYWGLSVPASIPVASYAASARKIAETASERSYISRALERQVAVSVREATLQAILSGLTTKPVEHVLDPTLLVDESVYAELVKDIPLQTTPYVLVYQVAYDAALVRIAQDIAREVGPDCKVVEVAAYADASRNSGCEWVNSASPEEFLSYIRGARYVVTSSFHGTALSIVFRRPFSTVHMSKDLDERATSLLSALGLEGCWMEKTERGKLREVDFESAYQKLSALRKSSADYLNRVITSVEKRDGE